LWLCVALKVKSTFVETTGSTAVFERGLVNSWQQQAKILAQT
jgi:hypothetical protein